MIKPGTLCLIIPRYKNEARFKGLIVTTAQPFSEDGHRCHYVLPELPGIKGVAERALRPINAPPEPMRTTPQEETA